VGIAEAAAVATMSDGGFDLWEYDQGFKAEGIFLVEVAVIVGSETLSGSCGGAGRTRG